MVVVSLGDIAGLSLWPSGSFNSSKMLKGAGRRDEWLSSRYTELTATRNGNIKASGYTISDVLTGYWEWFRKDATRMRSGYFENGKQVGGWTTL
jgi:hypothetical protein